MLREINFQLAIVPSPSLSFTLPLSCSFSSLISYSCSQPSIKPKFTSNDYKVSTNIIIPSWILQLHFIISKKLNFIVDLKEILKVGCCFLVSDTTVSSTHGYMVSILIQLYSILCITQTSTCMYMHIIIFIWVV